MDNKQRLRIFHLYRKDGTALFLHPFGSIDKVQDILDKTEIIGKYGKEPRVESLTLFRNDLYRMIEAAVKSWMAERKFIPRFLISTAVFLVVYFILSFVVRDPLPMVDELAGGLGAALAMYFYLSKRGQSSRLASELRIKLRTKVDKIIFEQDEFVLEVEKILEENEEYSKDIILKKLVEPGEDSLTIREKEEAWELLGYLEKKFKKKDLKQQEKILLRLSRGSGQEKDYEQLSRWFETQKIDIPLFAVYARVKRSYEKVR